MSDVAQSMDRVLVLRSCPADMKTTNGFVYPESGYVEAPDWDGGLDECGGGLHGFRWGVGSGGLAHWQEDAKWLVIAVKPDEIIDVTVDGGGKCKFKGGEVLVCADRKTATDYLQAGGAVDKPIVGCFKTGGDYSTLTGGDYSTLTGGDYSTLTGGDRSTLTGGDRSTLTGGDRSTLTGGYGSTLTWKYYDMAAGRCRLHTVYPGEDGVMANIPYQFDSDKKIIAPVK